MDIAQKIQQPLPLPGNAAANRADIPAAARRSEVVQGPVEIASIPNVDIRAADERRLNAIRDNLQNGSFVVSDRTFTIYKDSSGQYITRYTSLRDGSVTYVPEAELTKTAPAEPLFDLDV